MDIDGIEIEEVDAENPAYIIAHREIIRPQKAPLILGDALSTVSLSITSGGKHANRGVKLKIKSDEPPGVSIAKLHPKDPYDVFGYIDPGSEERIRIFDGQVTFAAARGRDLHTLELDDFKNRGKPLIITTRKRLIELYPILERGTSDPYFSRMEGLTMEFIGEDFETLYGKIQAEVQNGVKVLV